MATRCPYCDSDVRESAIEAEDGCCPECGAILGATRSFLDDPEDLDDLQYENDVYDDFDDEDDDHDFSRADLDDDDIYLDEELDGEYSDDEFDDFDEEEDDEDMK